MSADDSRVQLSAELQEALNEVAQLSDMILVLRTAHVLDEQKLKQLSNEWIAANLRAAELRKELQALGHK
jgi:hypothetical protein